MTKKKESSHQNNGQSTAPGEIDPGLLYTISEFRKRTGYGEAALRTLRRAGMQVLRRSGRGFIFGGDFLDFVRAGNG